MNAPGADGRTRRRTITATQQRNVAARKIDASAIESCTEATKVTRAAMATRSRIGAAGAAGTVRLAVDVICDSSVGAGTGLVGQGPFRCVEHARGFDPRQASKVSRLTGALSTGPA